MSILSLHPPNATGTESDRTGLLLAVTHLSAAEPPAPRKILFFDLWKLDHWEQLDLCAGEPRWIPEGTWHDPSAPTRGVHVPTVWRDEGSGTWRMIYSLQWSPFTLMAAESDDGVSWRPLPVPDTEPEGGKLAPNHMFTLTEGAGSTAYLDPMSTDGFRFRIFGRQEGEPVLRRAAADPGHPWHAVATGPDTKERRFVNEAVTLASRDGLHWELKTGGHWCWDVPGWHPEPPVFAFWNQREQRARQQLQPILRDHGRATRLQLRWQPVFPRPRQIDGQPVRRSALAAPDQRSHSPAFPTQTTKSEPERRRASSAPPPSARSQ